MDIVAKLKLKTNSSNVFEALLQADKELEAVEKAIQVVTPIVNFLAKYGNQIEKGSNIVDGASDGFAKSLELVLKLKILNGKMKELDQTKYKSRESYSQQGPSQRRNEIPPTCYYCGKVSHIEPRVRNNIGDMKHSLLEKINTTLIDNIIPKGKVQQN
ncbi:hypothetical protein CDAR_459381 [Caerostris darwini]|uniref:Uncharacterized protein n=1 Tax=Caerostris darwini TaxID=1538125 RepID=A0AAV4UDK3_9ARAC|nr:hypothetical protein CDAR_459381 [Caerostris darwini]